MSRPKIHEGKTCEFPGCNNPSSSIGKKVAGFWCRGHYQQQYSGREMRPLGRYTRQDFDSLTEKTCNACGKTKAVGEFYRSGRYYQPACKECQKEAGRLARRLFREQTGSTPINYVRLTHEDGL